MEVLNPSTSDHSPFLFTAPLHNSLSVPKSFQFQQMWLGCNDFLEVVGTSWVAIVKGFGMYFFLLKLRRLKAALRDWNKNKFGNVIENVCKAEE